MRISLCFILALGFLFSGCGKKQQAEPPKPTNAPAVGDNPLNAPAEYIGALGQAQKMAGKTIDNISVQKAIEAFFASEDRYPKDLNELVKQRYIPRLPDLPRGMVYEYNPTVGKVRVVKQQ
jgi:hypothetical protein